MVVMCDVDNVIAMLQERVLEIFNERYNKNYTLDDFTDYNIENDLPVQESRDFKKIYGESGLYNTVKPIAGAQNGLRKLVDSGHTVFLVTDAVPSTYGEKVDFIKHYFPFIDSGHIVAMKHKEYFKCDIMIEDNMQNLLAKPYYYRVCLDYPWNRNVHDDVYDIHRCYDWNEIVAAVEQIAEEDRGLLA